TLITFQESREDVFSHFRQRIENSKSRLRANDVSFLLYALLHATVDAYFPLLEKCAERIEELERRVLTRPTQAVLQQIHRLRRDTVPARGLADARADSGAAPGGPRVLPRKYQALPARGPRPYFRRF